jgi:alkanesulfonate monooxygenase SsuD/methylene tetrahydromethanopterin reductase-like flavin-dependent oxidoreductase (luciferase family)
MTGALSIGVAGALGPDAVARIAVAAERAGLHALWVNDTPDGDALAALAAAARVTSSLTLATGVIPVDRRDPADIARAAADIPAERLVVGIGSGAARVGALDRVADAVARLHEAGIAHVVVGALGPRMRRLAAEQAEGVLLNWVPAAQVASQRAEVRAVSPACRVAVYVRTALDPAASGRLAAEAARYGSYPNYAANLARLGVHASDTAFDGAASLAAGVGAYRAAADEVVLRAITANDDAAEYERFIAAAVAGAAE